MLAVHDGGLELEVLGRCSGLEVCWGSCVELADGCRQGSDCEERGDD